MPKFRFVKSEHKSAKSEDKSSKSEHKTTKSEHKMQSLNISLQSLKLIRTEVSWIIIDILDFHCHSLQNNKNNR